jgi:hypothetical protein
MAIRPSRVPRPGGSLASYATVPTIGNLLRHRIGVRAGAGAGTRLWFHCLAGAYLLLRLKQQIITLTFLPGGHEISRLCALDKAPEQTRNGHRSQLAGANGAFLATLDKKIPRVYFIPESRPLRSNGRLRRSDRKLLPRATQIHKIIVNLKSPKLSRTRESRITSYPPAAKKLVQQCLHHGGAGVARRDL